MPYCPHCLIEYREGTRKCLDCRQPLLPGPSPHRDPEEALDLPPDVKLVTVRVFTGLTATADAALAKNLLETQGIPAIVSGWTAAGLLPGLDLPLLVREEDLERAAEILKGFLDSPGPISAAE